MLIFRRLHLKKNHTNFFKYCKRWIKLFNIFCDVIGAKKDHQRRHEELVSPEMVPSVAFNYETLTKNYNRCFVFHLPEGKDCLMWPLKLWHEDTFSTRVSAENETPKRRGVRRFVHFQKYWQEKRRNKSSTQRELSEKCSKIHMKYII